MYIGEQSGRIAHSKGRFRLLSAITAGAGIAASVATVCAGPLPPIHREQDLRAQDIAGPVVIYNRPYTGAIYADYVPAATEVAARLAPAMARNEYEPMQDRKSVV